MWWRRGGSVDVMGSSINKHLERMTSVRKTEELEMDEIQKHTHTLDHTQCISFFVQLYSFSVKCIIANYLTKIYVHTATHTQAHAR